MTKIAILQCKNTKEDLGCSSILCYKDLNENEGKFKQHLNPQLAGTITCAGCPTVLGPEKLFRRIEGLANSGIEALHFSSCMMALCPYKNKYAKMIEENFPELNLIMGTHDDPGNASPEEFIGMVKSIFATDSLTIDKAANQILKEI